ncbi:Succinate dehydrogenase assembly factor 2 mitochondrial [Naganishia albida]|nr:Succinate dehydrogenase assembly factor 2 mitochondrial [Naganishia albida]
MLARTLRLARPARLPLLVPSARYVHQSKPTPPNERPSLATDPYPLPLTQPLADDPSAAPQRSGQTSLDTLDEELSLPQPLDRTGEDVDTLRARLVYQTRKRGTLETDLILSTFAKEHLPTMSEEEMKQFDKLLDEPDWDIFYWSVEKRTPPERWQGSSLLEKLKKHAKNEGRVVRVMPELNAEGKL